MSIDVFAEANERFTNRIRANRFVEINMRRMFVSGCLRFLDIDQSVPEVKGVNAANAISIVVSNVVSGSRVDFLRWESVAMQRRGLRFQHLDKLQLRDRSTLRWIVFPRKVTQSKILSHQAALFSRR